MSQSLPFVLYEPTGGQAPHPVIVFLHGSGERGDGDFVLAKKHGLPKYLDQGNTLPAYVLVPQCPLNVGWGDVLSRLDRTITDVIAAHDIDQRRLYITGFSMGGYGSWSYVTHYPTRFAAMLPVAGTGFHQIFLRELDPCAIGSTPVWIIQSGGDPIVPASRSDVIVANLTDCGANFKYTRYETEDHGETAQRAFFDPAIYEWLFQQTKP